MDADFILVVGLVLAVFPIPSIVSAFSDNRAPRVAAIVLLIGGGLSVYAISNKPGGYTLAEIPNVFVQVVGRYVN